jgi:trehalose synthase
VKRHLISAPRRGKPIGDNPLWYKDAIIYEARVRSFFDSNNDGVGDFRGLSAKLDYLQDLGVTAIWLLPFYPSPLRDDGYDIADYTDVHPDCGTLADFDLLLEEAHQRGLRIITELVLNHTSDQHPWFRRARRAPAGSAERDFYVWNDSPERYHEARIIFKDFESSNWSWDPLARAYYWHRFYAHQPDLNFENPAVHEALLSVVDFWLEKGVDGLRLDAVPYLFESEGTNCENLPETHGFLRKLRAHIDGKFKDRMLLAEANQWPEDAAAYFGTGDECHMNFHFPIMPRMFMAIHMEDRFPLLDILAQTPQIPANCQWALFLRNHDELTLEMVTDEERDYMYRAYAHATEMRINLGIRRRLAPLVGNDRRKMELLHGLLFSLPGTPVLYYGDEIGMGDNVFLGDRNGVRTPMQWSADRNAGFSRANPQRMILPITIDPEYHYEAINVEAQQNNPNSLLWWTKRLITLRKQFQAFGRGTMEVLTAGNYRVLGFMRHYIPPGPLGAAGFPLGPSGGGGFPPPPPRLRRAKPSSVNAKTRRSWSSPTCRAIHSTSSSISESGRGCVPSSCSATPNFRPSASSLTCSRWAGMLFTGSPSSRHRRRRPPIWPPPTSPPRSPAPAPRASFLGRTASRWRTPSPRSSTPGTGSPGAPSASLPSGSKRLSRWGAPSCSSPGSSTPIAIPTSTSSRWLSSTRSSRRSEAACRSRGRWSPG